MRAFIAIELPPEIRDSLALLQAGLKETGADVKWVQPQNIHLTLKFLGEIDERQSEEIKRILGDIAGEQKAFLLHLSSLGAFPKINYPRVIWVGVDKGAVETQQIAEQLEEKASGIGIPAEDRTFSSHITLGRVRSGLNRERLARELNNPAVNDPLKVCRDFPVTRITLFKSDLTPKGPVYEILKEAYLKEA